MESDTEVQTQTRAPIYREHADCRSCGQSIEPILSLGEQYLPRFPEAKDETLPRAPLELGRCSACGLLQLMHTVNADLLYREFWYRSAINETMRAAMRDLVKDGMRHHGNGAWLDIGANDGYLLSVVPKGFHRVACEPAYNFADELRVHSDQVVSDYFSAAKCSGPYDVVTSAACFYDVDDPDRFVADIARVLSPRGVWINQLNDAPGMLRQNAFDSICHEHLCYYDVPTLRKLYAKHGLTITRVSHNDVNGGSIRLTAMKAGRRVAETDLLGLPPVSRDEAWSFARTVERWRGAMLKVLSPFASGHIWGYGASTKGTVLLQYLDAPGLFKAIADKNPRKLGKVMAGTWIPIHSEESLRAVKPSLAVVLPWAFAKEFDEREKTTRALGTAFLYPLPSIRVMV